MASKPHSHQSQDTGRVSFRENEVYHSGKHFASIVAGVENQRELEILGHDQTHFWLTVEELKAIALWLETYVFDPAYLG